MPTLKFKFDLFSQQHLESAMFKVHAHWFLINHCSEFWLFIFIFSAKEIHINEVLICGCKEAKGFWLWFGMFILIGVGSGLVKFNWIRLSWVGLSRIGLDKVGLVWWTEWSLLELSWDGIPLVWLEWVWLGCVWFGLIGFCWIELGLVKLVLVRLTYIGWVQLGLVRWVGQVELHKLGWIGWVGLDELSKEAWLWWVQFAELSMVS